MQLNFEVIVDGEDVVISDEEHQAYRWIDESRVENVGVTAETRRHTLDAFAKRHVFVAS